MLEFCVQGLVSPFRSRASGRVELWVEKSFGIRVVRGGFALL